MKVINKKQAFVNTMKYILENWKSFGVHTHYLYDTDNIVTSWLYKECEENEQWHLINITKNLRPEGNGLKG